MIIHNASITGSFSVNGTNVASITSSQASIDALNTFSSSILSFTASTNTFTASAATTGSNTFVGNQVITGSLTVSGSITTPGTLTAQTLVVQTITSSVDFVTGSTRFGSLSSNTHVFTGSMNVSGGLEVNAPGTTFDGGSGSMRVYINRGQATSSYVSSIIFSVGGGNVSTGYSEIGNIGNAGDLYFNTDSTPGTYTRRMTIQGSNGNVGIGSTNPSYKLDVGGSIQSSNYFSSASATISGLLNRDWAIMGRGTVNGSALLINDIAGANYAIATGGYNLSFYKHISGSNTFGNFMTVLASGANDAVPSIAISGSLAVGSLSSPSYTLDVTGTSRFTGAAAFSSSITAGGNIQTDGGANKYIKSTGFISNQLGQLSDFGGSDTGFYAISGGGLQFVGGGQNRVRMTSDGNLFVGTTTGDGYRLQIVGGTQASTTFGQTFAGVAAYSQWVNSSGAFVMGLDGAAGTTERMRITSGGVVGIGNTSPNSTYALGVKYSTSTIRNGIDAINQYEGTGTAGVVLSCYNAISGIVTTQILGNGGLSNYQGNNVNLSDIRLKTDIQPVESYWNKFKALEIVKFKYKNIDTEEDPYTIGVIAQQVEEVAPEFVNNECYDERSLPEDGIPLKSIYTADLHHATIKVLQEAMAKIEELKAEFDEYKLTHP